MKHHVAHVDFDPAIIGELRNAPNHAGGLATAALRRALRPVTCLSIAEVASAALGEPVSQQRIYGGLKTLERHGMAVRFVGDGAARWWPASVVIDSTPIDEPEAVEINDDPKTYDGKCERDGCQNPTLRWGILKARYCSRECFDATPARQEELAREKAFAERVKNAKPGRRRKKAATGRASGPCLATLNAFSLPLPGLPTERCNVMTHKLGANGECEVGHLPERCVCHAEVRP